MAPIRNKEVDIISASQENFPDPSSSWKLDAAINQQEICNLVINYDWESYENNEREFLEKKVEYVIFGPTENTIDNDTKELIKNICRKIVEEGINGKSPQNVYMAFICIFWYKTGSNLQCWPVFKVPKNENKSDALFIDINARVYKNWNDFLNNNQFPPCEYCFPKGGIYTTDEENKIILEYGLSPANKLSNKLMKYLDLTNAGLALGTTAVSAVSLVVPVASPFLQASVWLTRGICAYSTVRSGSTLYDRGIHKQSVGLDNSESRSCWLAIGASTVGVASSSATSVAQKMAQTGQVVGKIGCATTNALIISNVAVNGLGILHNLHGLIEKYKRNQLFSLDVFQLSASMLLFAHAVVNVKTAKSIIENAQNNVLQDFENNLRSNRHRRMFRKVARNTKGQQNAVEGNAKVIRTLKYIDNVDDFFSALVRMDKQFRPTESKVALAEGGLIQVNEHLSVDPTQLVEASIDDRILLLEATKKYVSNQISEVEFIGLAEELLGEIPSVQPSTSKNFPSLRDLLGLGKETLRNLSQTEFRFSYPLLNAYERMELMTLLKKFAESDHENILRMASVLFKALGWTSGDQYVEVAYFVCGLIKNVASNAKIDRNICENQLCMLTSEYCIAALKEFLQDPSKLVHIFNHVRMLFSVLSTRNSVPTQLRHVSLFEISQLSSILLRMDEPFWLRCLSFSEEITRTLGLKQYETIIKIVKGLCLYINQTLKDMERRHYRSLPDNTPNLDELWSQSTEERTNRYCNTIMDNVSSDSEIQQSLIEEIWKSSELHTSNNLKSQIIPKYTRQQPLELTKKFWNGDQLTLLSEEEILDVCKLALETDNCPMNCHIEFDGCNIFVNVDDKLVTIKCMIDEEQISAFVDRAVALQ